MELTSRGLVTSKDFTLMAMLLWPTPQNDSGHKSICTCISGLVRATETCVSLPTLTMEVITATYLLWLGPFFSALSLTTLTLHRDRQSGPQSL